MHRSSPAPTSVLGACILILTGSGLTAQEAPQDPTSDTGLIYAVGADLSFLKSAEDSGIQFKDGGVVKPGLDMFRDHGYDWIRLRIFHTPTELPNDLEYTIALAQDAKERGFRFLLDYHYADGWADPQKQPIPAAWDTTDVGILADAVREGTSYTIRAFREAGVMPDMVQIGNEVRNGMMWPLGKLPDNWDNFARLFQAGLDGIDDGRGPDPMPPIMLHYLFLSLGKVGYSPDQVVTTLENKMKCGIGHCGRCYVGPFSVCRDGPVVTWAALHELPKDY